MKKKLISLLLVAAMATQPFASVLAAGHAQALAAEQAQQQVLAGGGEITENTTALTGGVWTVNSTPGNNGVDLFDKKITVTGVNEITLGKVAPDANGNYLFLGGSVITIQPGAQLTIKAGPSYNIVLNGAPAIINHGTLILDCGCLDVSSMSAVTSEFAIRNEKDGTLIVRGAADVVSKDTILVENYGDVRIEGGKIASSSRGLDTEVGRSVIRQLAGSLTMTAGKLINRPYESEDYPIIDLQGGTLSVTGGKIIQKIGLSPSKAAAVHVANPKLADGVSIADGVIEIYSGVNPYVSGMPAYAVTKQITHATVSGLGETASLYNPIRMSAVPDAGYIIREVSYTVGGGDKQILIEENGSYTIPGSKITGDIAITVTAAESFTIRFEGNGGSGSMPEEANRTAGEYTLPACGFSAPTDSRFIGWQVDGDSSRTYQPGEKITITENTVLKAIWGKIDYVNVTLKAGAGSGEDQISRVEKNTEFTFPKCTFTPPAGGEGTEMGFAGWEIGGKIYQSGDKLQITSGLVITATWKDMKVVQVQADQTNWYDGSKMKLTGNVVMNQVVNVFGVVELELGEGKTLTVSGIDLSPNAKLTICGTGTLIVESAEEDVVVLNDGSKLQIDSGTVTVTTTKAEYEDYRPRAIFNDYNSSFNTIGAIELNGGDLTVNGDLYVGLGTMTVNGGNLTANMGIQVKKSPDGKRVGTLTVNGGSVTAKSSGWGAAIGSLHGRYSGELPQFCSACGNIFINGGKVWAEVAKTSNSEKPAAIGSGARAGEGNIVITGGDITAMAESPADGIGSASYATSKAAFSTGENGCAVIRTEKIMDNADRKAWSCIIGQQNVLTVYSNPTLKQDLIIAEDETLYVPADSTLTVPTGIRLVNNGVIKNIGRIQGKMEGKEPQPTVEVKFVFAAGRGTGAMESRVTANGLPFTLPECTFTAPAGYEFIKWQIGDRVYEPGDVITAERSTVISAVWRRENLKLEALPDVSSLSGSAHKAFDGNLETTWTKGGCPASAYLRFKAEKPVAISQLEIESTYESLPSFCTLQVLKNEEEFLKITDQGQQNDYLKNPSNWIPAATVDNTPDRKHFACISIGFAEVRQYYSLYCDETTAPSFQITELRMYPLNNPCDIVFTAGTAVGADQKKRVEQNKEFVLPACTYTKRAHRFIGWKADDGRMGKPGEPFLIKGRTTLTAQWEQVPMYTLTLNANGSEGQMEPVIWEMGNEFPLPACTFTKPGYIFAGWQAGEKRYQPGDLFVMQADTELMAMWYRVNPVRKSITMIGYSDAVSGEGPENLFDGIYENSQTKWCSTTNRGNNQWVAFSLTEAIRLTKMTVVHAKGAGEDNAPNTIDYELQIMIDPAAYEAADDRQAYLSDDANWKNIAVVRNNTLDITETPITTEECGKYYRFHITDSGDYNDWGAARIYELALESLINEKVTGHALTLADEIEVNFKADLGIAPAANTYMLFTVENPGVAPIKVSLSEAKKTEGTTYVFSCPMAAKEMTDTIRAALYIDGSLMLTDSYSATEYADFVLKDTTGAYDHVKPVVRAMLNYGAAAQRYFNYRTKDLANSILSEEQKKPIATFDVFNSFNYKAPAGAVTGLTYYASSLNLTSAAGLFHYFKLAPDAAISDYKFELVTNDKTVELAVEDRRGMKAVEITGINAKGLNMEYTLRVTKGTEVMTLIYSPYTYAKLSMGKAALADIMLAMADYCQAANAYRA